MKLSMFIILFSLIAAFSCKERKEHPKELLASPDDNFIYVQKELLDEKLSDYQNNKVSEVIYMLLSTGGWSNTGQYIIRQQSDKIILEYSAPNQNTFTTHTLDAQKFEEFKQKTPDYQEYDNYNPQIFDSFRYNYLHISVNKGKITFIKKLYMNSPGTDREGENKPYLDLVESFFKFNPTH